MNNIHEVLAKVLPDSRKVLNEINYGGCGIFAHELQQALALLGVQSSVVLVGNDSFMSYTRKQVDGIADGYGEGDLNVAYRNIFKEYAGLDRREYPDTCNGHLALQIGDTLFDSDGIYNRGHAISDGIDPDVMELFIKAPLWNSDFVEFNGGDKDSITNTLKAFFADTLTPVVEEYTNAKAN